MKKLAVTLAALMVIASTGCGTDSNAVPQALTYVAHGSDNLPHLFTLNTTTKTSTAVAISIPTGSWFVAPNPDVTAVAYERNDVNGNHIFFMGKDSVEKQLTTDSNAFAPTFSPDGKTIAYNDQPANSNYEIFTMSLDGTNQKALYAPPVGTLNQYDPRFSPDGKSVVFYIQLACGAAASRHFDDAQATSRTHMRSGYQKNIAGVCSGPQGTPSQSGWYSMALTDTTPTLVYATNNWWGPPAYSVDGKKLFITDYDGIQWNIFSVNVDGTAVAQITTNTDVGSFSAVPYQNGVLFNREGNGNSTWDIYTMGSTGANQVLVNSTPSTYESLVDAYWGD